MTTQIDLLKKYGLPIKGKLGQHLLIDPNVQRKIVDLLDAAPADRLLEIGPGLGALTQEMLKRGLTVTAVEKDPRFSEILEKEFGAAYPGRLKIFTGDFLKFDLNKLRDSPASGPGIKVISNLPYYITAPILFRLAESQGLVRSAVLTMQKEVAARILADPGTKDYGRLSVALRFFAGVRHCLDVPPSCFTPRPEVDSSVLVLNFYPEPGFGQKVGRGFFSELVRIAFSQRRKKLLSLLCQNAKPGSGREDISRVLEAAGFDADVRGERLTPEEFVRLAVCLEQARVLKVRGADPDRV